MTCMILVMQILCDSCLLHFIVYTVLTEAAPLVCFTSLVSGALSTLISHRENSVCCLHTDLLFIAQIFRLDVLQVLDS